MKVLAGLLCLVPSLLHSQEAGGELLVRPSLFVTSPQLTQPFDIGIRFEIEPEWYLYWINPGDAGLTVDVQWDLPEHWTAGPLRFPTPEKIVKEGITAFGYHDELVLLCRITPAQAGGKTVSGLVRARLEWLVCRESCLPGRAEVSMPLDGRALAEAVMAPERLERYQERFPVPLESRDMHIQALEVRPQGAARTVGVLVSGRQASELIDFYPEPIEGFSIDFSTIRVAEGQIQMLVTPHSSTSEVRSVRGIAILPDGGVWLEASVTPH